MSTRASATRVGAVVVKGFRHLRRDPRILAMVLLMPAGFAMMTLGISTNTLMQSAVDDQMRGRVMAYYVMAFIGMLPASSLIAGYFSHEIGAPWTLTAGGLLVVAAASISFWRR